MTSTLKAALVALSLCANVLAASACIQSEPHIDCNFYTLSSPKWPELSAKAFELTAAWKSAAAEILPYPHGRFWGRGLVITATKVDMVNVPVILKVLQSQGFELPVEIWCSGNVDADLIHTLAEAYKHLVIKNVANYAKENDLRSTVTSQGERAFQVKPLAILNSQFEEVFFMDADNIPMSNPVTLFDSVEYKRSGALLWPDFWQTATQNPIWSILGLASQGFEQESGQMVLNKRLSWDALNLAFFLAKDSTFQQMVNGDKEAFRLAFLASGTPFHMVETPVAVAGSLRDGKFCGHTMVQHNLRGEAVFLHHNSMKHGAAISWEVLKSVASFGGSFSVVPHPGKVIKGAFLNCVDMVGADVIITKAPYTAFERVYAENLESTDATLKQSSAREFAYTFNEQRRKLLQANGTATACSPELSTCYQQEGAYFICCTEPCTGFNADLSPICPGTQIGDTPTPAPTGPPILEGGTACRPDLFTCYQQLGAYFICCTEPCLSFYLDQSPVCPGIEVATTRTNAALSIPPVDGRCPSADYPNPCFAADGSSSICCRTSCDSESPGKCYGAPLSSSPSDPDGFLPGPDGRGGTPVSNTNGGVYPLAPFVCPDSAPNLCFPPDGDPANQFCCGQGSCSSTNPGTCA